MIFQQLRQAESSPDEFLYMVAVVINMFRLPDLLTGPMPPAIQADQIQKLQPVVCRPFCKTMEAEFFI